MKNNPAALHAILLESMRLNGDEIRGRTMATDSHSDEVRRALEARDLADMKADLADLKAQYVTLAAERERALRWGLIVLGSAVLAMGGFIFKVIASKAGL